MASVSCPSATGRSASRKQHIPPPAPLPAASAVQPIRLVLPPLLLLLLMLLMLLMLHQLRQPLA